MKKLIKENIRNKFLSGIISENQYHEMMESNIGDNVDLSAEEAAKKAMGEVDKLAKSPEMNMLASKVAADPALMNQLKDLVSSKGVSLNEAEGGEFDFIKKLALSFAEEGEKLNEYTEYRDTSYDDKPEDEGKVAAGFLGFFGGGFIGAALTKIAIAALPVLASGFALPALIGAIAGAAVGVLLVKAYHKIKGTGQVKENTIKEEYSDSGKYNLNNQNNIDNMMRDVTSIIAKYVGTNSTQNAAVANDNMVILYNMLNSGEFKNKISQMIPPSGMHQTYDEKNNKPQYWTNNPEAMAEFLNSIGITNHNFKSTEKSALDNMFKGSTPDDINF